MNIHERENALLDINLFFKDKVVEEAKSFYNEKLSAFNLPEIRDSIMGEEPLILKLLYNQYVLFSKQFSHLTDEDKIILLLNDYIMFLAFD
jgi:transcriptional regulator of heat shock response